VIRRIAGMVMRPRATLAELAARPAWAATWLFILIVWALCGGSLLRTDIGTQALVDERVRVVEAFGGTVTDDQYAALQARPPWWVYFTSGGRLLLTPVVTIVVAGVIWWAARAAGTAASWSQALSMTVHANVVLLLGQLIATPLHIVRESLTSPLNLAAILPFMEEGTLRARFFGSLDFFALWWAVLVAMALSVLTGRRVGHYAWRVTAVYAAFAGVIAAAIGVLGGA
jgi:Yip1 domain